MTRFTRALPSAHADDALRKRFSAIPKHRGPGDWFGVVELSLQIDRRSSRRPPAARRVALVALVLAVCAAPALALTAKWWPFATGANAPARIVHNFASLDHSAPSALRPNVVAGTSREFDAFKLRSGQPVRLWLAVARPRGFCAIIERFFEGCRKATAAGLVDFGMTAAPRSGRWVLAGDVTTASQAPNLEVVFRDGARVPIKPVWISPPIDAGFFLYEIPRERWTQGKQPIRIVVRDVRGQILDRVVLPLARPHRLSPRG